MGQYISQNVCSRQGHVGNEEFSSRGRIYNREVSRDIVAPNFGISVLSVRQISSKRGGFGVLFRAGAKILDEHNQIMGYAPKPKHKSEMYPLVCSIVSGYVRSKETISDARIVDEFLALNSDVSSKRVIFSSMRGPHVRFKNQFWS